MMDLRFKRQFNWTYAAASVAIVAIALLATAPRDSAAVGEPVGVVAPVEEAAAGITFKIVPADVMSFSSNQRRRNSSLTRFSRTTVRIACS